MQTFDALVVEESEIGLLSGIRRLRVEDLPEGELLIEVAYSSMNYKDALACSANGNVVKTYPFVPGIDLAGVVVESSDGSFRKGDEVVVTGFGLGVSHYGGYSKYARVPAAWAVPLPQGLTLKEAMVLGTAGFTAALSVQALREHGITPDKGPVLVTGATGGVGSTAVAMLAKLGYKVAASTGKADKHDELLALGATQIVSRETLTPDNPPPLNKQLWAGAVDCVGGKSLAYILSSIQYAGAAAVSGLMGGTELPATIFPFILRGVSLIGIDSVFVPMAKRTEVWRLLASELKPDNLDAMHREISLAQVPEQAKLFLAGQSVGRIVVVP
jgi:putative YhdH/YhfP family quinone oxidoreductase